MRVNMIWLAGESGQDGEREDERMTLTARMRLLHYQKRAGSRARRLLVLQTT